MFRAALRDLAPCVRAIHNIPKGAQATPEPTRPAPALDGSKRPQRGGQNLSERHIRLEKSLRAKAALSGHIVDTPGPARPYDAGELPRVRPARETVRTFRGFVIPEEPKPPEPDECCMSGCAICVHDIYAESLTAYSDALIALRTQLMAAKMPQTEWPAEIMPRPGEKQTIRQENAAASAFEEMERRLAAKRADTS